MANVFAYTGYRRVFYFKYLDIRAGHTLVADPGQQYEIQATESDISVPPADGLWSLVYPSSPKSVSKFSPTETGVPLIDDHVEVDDHEEEPKPETEIEIDLESEPEPEPALDSSSETESDPKSKVSESKLDHTDF